MDAIIELLNHPYVVRKHIAKRLYRKDTIATYERLRSRAKRRHRLREEEYEGLDKIYTEIAEILSLQSKQIRRAVRFPNTSSSQEFRQSLKANIGHECLQLKAILNDASADTEQNYFKLYDKLRDKSKLKDEDLTHIAQKLEEFAKLIHKKLKKAKKEAKRYQFSMGQGQHSHLLDN